MKKILVYVGLVIAGSMFSKQIQGVLGGIPVIGDMLAGVTKKGDGSTTDKVV